MHQVKAYKRGWVAEAPKACTDAMRRDAAADKLSPTFVWSPEGKWCLTLRASEETSNMSDVTLDVSQECLRVVFPGQSPHLIVWPPGTGAAEMDACSARFSKRRGDLVITLPASQSKILPSEVSADTETPASALVHQPDRTCAGNLPTCSKIEEPATCDSGAGVLIDGLRKAAARVQAARDESSEATPSECANSPCASGTRSWICGRICAASQTRSSRR